MCDVCLSRTNGIIRGAISFLVVYEMFQTENGSAMFFVLQCFPDKDAYTSKHRNKGEKPRTHVGGRGTSNPVVVVSYVRLSQLTERRWQTKLQSYVDANESHCIAWLSPLCCALLRYCVCADCLPLVNLWRSSLSAIYKLDVLANTTSTNQDELDVGLSCGDVSLSFQVFANILQFF